MAAAALLGAACVGNIGNERGTAGGGGGGGSSGGGASGSSGGSSSSSSGSNPPPPPMQQGPGAVLSYPNGPAPVARLRRLTTPEFTYSVQDLLGGTSVPISAVDPDVSVGVWGPSAVNLGGFATIGASSVSTSPSGVGLYEAAVRGATTAAFGNMSQLSSILSCVPTSTTDPCLTTAINAFGRRAFRRPLTSAETMTLVNLATTIGGQSGNTVLNGLQYALNAILQWPDFLYRVELGAPSAADNGRLKYSSYEIASRLAATLWSSVPDDTLLDAAGMDALSTPAGITTQAQRMIADPRAHRALAAFTDELFALQGMSTVSKDATLFPAWTATLGSAMQQELELRVDDMVFNQKGNFFSLFTSTSTFANSELAKFYGLSAPSGTGFQPVTFPSGSPRVGILGSGAILATEALADRTSPVKRGLLVDQMLRCEVISAPPPGVPPLPPTLSSNMTVRQELDNHVANPACSSCHSLLDPIGFGMENFDATGQYRTTEKGMPIDASGTLNFTDASGKANSIAFHDLGGLEAALQQDPATAPCLVANFYVRALGRAAIGFDEPSINTLTTQFAAAGNKVDQLLVSLVSSDSFRFVVPQ